MIRSLFLHSVVVLSRSQPTTTTAQGPPHEHPRSSTAAAPPRNAPTSPPTPHPTARQRDPEPTPALPRPDPPGYATSGTDPDSSASSTAHSPHDRSQRITSTRAPKG
ncbi:uncharacterized protein LOC136043106 [Artemia franciscana]|uniref:uncharacterized protein LOC136043106 n=1 Tax=Artemia franciscana TaxID=6661 RepID=UPI0032DB4819